MENAQRGRSIVTLGNSVKCRDRRGTERRSGEWVRRSAGRFARGRRLRFGAPRRSLVGRRSTPAHGRSEEHTSELQSRLHLVCRLLLEKKKKNRNTQHCGSAGAVPH